MKDSVIKILEINENGTNTKKWNGLQEETASPDVWAVSPVTSEMYIVPTLATSTVNFKCLKYNVQVKLINSSLKVFVSF